MIDNDIIKALEWHLNDEIHCSNCPYEEHSVTHFCYEFVMKDALDLINRQKAEIERLEKDSKRLKKVQMQLDDAMKMYTTIKAEAVKEFAERLKAVSHPYADTQMVFELQIDNLVKEMVGEQNV